MQWIEESDLTTYASFLYVYIQTGHLRSQIRIIAAEHRNGAELLKIRLPI